MQEFISESIEYNRADNITLHRFALGEEEGNLELKIPVNHSGAASLVESWYKKNKYIRIQTQVRSLSTVLREIGTERIRFVKIDVEGFEPQVLRGAYAAFSTNPPDAILVELKTSGSVQKHPTIMLLQELGYDFLSMHKEFNTIRLRHFDPDVSEYVGTDLLASPRGEVFNEVAARVGASS